MKIILQLRNPVHRAWSQYNEEVRKGRECIPFNDAITDEEHRINSSDYAKYHLSYLKGGDYFDLVQSLLQFFSKDQILILIFEDTINDYHNATDKICNFLNIRDGIDINNSTLYKNKNKDYLVKRKLFNSKFFNPIIRFNDRMLKSRIG